MRRLLSDNLQATSYQDTISTYLLQRKVSKTIAETPYTFTYYDTCTQEDYERKGRFWLHIQNFTNGGFNKDTDRVMVCGGPEMNYECRDFFEKLGFQEGNLGEAGDFVLERAFVD